MPSKFIVKWVFAPLIVILLLYAYSEIYDSYYRGPNYVSPTELLKSLDLRKDVSEIKPGGELASAFEFNSKYTDVQRENLLKKIKDKLIIWEVKVYEVKRLANNKYKIQTQSAIFCESVSTFITLTAKDELQVKFIEEIKTDQVIRVKGILTGKSTVRHLEIAPAILWYPGSNAKSSESNFNLDNAKDLTKINCN
jgi:hypothetical protein